MQECPPPQEEAIIMWGQIKKYSPVMMIVGYALVYMNKGWNYVMSDIQNITLEKLMNKWQNFAVAAIAIVAIQLVSKAKLPAALKTMLIALLYLIAGHQIATAIDPPTNGSYSSGRAPLRATVGYGR